MENEYYEKRYVSDSIKIKDIFVLDEDNKNTLKDVINISDKIFLLGNPGSGKTTELKNLFEQLWEIRKNTSDIPFYIDLKNFEQANSFEDLILFKEWKDIPFITLIIDGLDEIAEISRFVQSLNLFLDKNNDRSIRVIISCRTNIYEKYLIDIKNFRKYYLDDLNENQIRNILKKKFSIDITYGDLNKYSFFLENPFNLYLFANYYTENDKNFPSTLTEAFNFLINRELDLEFRHTEAHVNDIISCLEKIAVVNELMQQNFINEINLKELICHNDFLIIQNISYIRKEDFKYIFKHKNYQEYFAARFISRLNFNKILDIISISYVSKINPSFLQTVSFLLNVLETDELINWLLENDSEVLFLANPQRIPTEIRHKVFRDFFNETVLERKMWIGSQINIPIDDIAKFADFEYLISFLNQKDIDFRIGKSVLDIMAIMNVEEDDILKDVLENMLFDNELNNDFKYNIIKVIRDRKYHIQYSGLFDRIVDVFSQDFDKEVNHLIISMINDFEVIDDYFSILLNCINNIYRIRPENKRDNVIRGTSWILEILILKIENKDHLFEILKILFSRRFDLKLSDFYDKNFRKNLINKISGFIEEDSNYLYKIVDIFYESEFEIYEGEGFLLNLIDLLDSRLEVFKYIISNYSKYINSYFLFLIDCSKEGVDFIIDDYLSGSLKLENHVVDNIKWQIFQNDHDLGYYFEDKMKKYGFDFLTKLESKKEILDKKVKFGKLSQDNFDILFEKENLINEIEDIFQKNNISEISWEQIHDISREWSEKNTYGVWKASFKAITLIIRDYGNQTLESIKNIFRNDYIILSLIQDSIKNNQSSFNISEEQKNFIENLCKKLISNFDYEEVIKFDENNTNRYSVCFNYYVLKTLYFFNFYFKLDYKKDFYIKTLKYSNIGDMNVGDDIFYYIKNKYDKDLEFEKQIISNINNEILDHFTMTSHVRYALDNELSETYNKIKEYILNDKQDVSFLGTLVDKIKNNKEKIQFLKDCCRDINSYLCWSAVKIFKKQNIEGDFILQLANKYLESDKRDYISYALSIYFYLNTHNAIEKYLISIEKAKELEFGKTDGYFLEDLEKYNNLKEVELLGKFFNLLYENTNLDVFDYHYSKDVFYKLILNLSKTVEGFNKIIKVFNKLKSDLKDNDSQLFYINNLLQQAENSYLSSISQGLSFEQSKKKID